MAVSAVACLLRWGLLAQSSSSAVAIAVAEPLHGLTFALLHLSCMRVLANIVPRRTSGPCASDLRDSRHRPRFSRGYIALRYALYIFWCPGLLGNVTNGCDGATRDLATLPSTQISLTGPRCHADRIGCWGTTMRGRNQSSFTRRKGRPPPTFYIVANLRNYCRALWLERQWKEGPGMKAILGGLVPVSVRYHDGGSC